MYSTSDLKRGLIVELDGAPQAVENVQVSSPSARGASSIYRVKFRNLKTRQRTEQSFRGGDTLAAADVERKPVQFLYSDPSGYHFMDTEDYEQFSLSREELEWESKFIIEGIEDLRALNYNGVPIALELPTTVTLKITECNPGVKGNSATGRQKPATLETGHVVQVPEHIDQDIKVSVDTRTGEFLGRVRD